MTDLLEADTSWRAEAACLGATATMYPERGDHDAVATAIGICVTCPVVAPCQQTAADDYWLWSGPGIVGGLTGLDRRRLGPDGRARVAAGETVAPTARPAISELRPSGDACRDRRGTISGRNRHRTAGERTCVDCRAAAAAYTRAYRARRRKETA